MDIKKAKFKNVPSIMFQDPNYKNSDSAMQNTRTDSLLSKLFFSPENLSLIHNQIIKTVLRESKCKYLIERQEDTPVMQVMRYVYLEYSNFLPNKGHETEIMKNNIIFLNNNVVDEIVPGIITQIKQQINYIDSITNSRDIMDRPKNVSHSGQKLLPCQLNSRIGSD